MGSGRRDKRGTVYERGGMLYLSFWQDGKRVQRSTGLRVGEEKLARELLRKTLAMVEVGAGGTSTPTVAEFAKKWIDGRRGRVRTVRDEETRLRMHVLPSIGRLPIDELRPRHVIEVVQRISAADYGLAPKSVHNVFSTLRTMLRRAKLEELIVSNPCEGVSSEYLPAAVDADPEWREGAVFSRAELEQLISDERIPVDRRVFYALEGLAALRLGEAAGLRWRHYDVAAEPLGRLLIATSFDSKRTKTERSRRVPVHPTLAAMLAEWRLAAWPAIFGRAPGPDDLIVPLTAGPGADGRPNPRHGIMRSQNAVWKRWQADLARLGLRHRRGHDLRATFITLAEDDGADPHRLERVTHTAKPSRNAYGAYSRPQWEELCREVAKLRVRRLARAQIVALRPVKAAAGGDDASEVLAEEGSCVTRVSLLERAEQLQIDEECRRRDSNP